VDPTLLAFLSKAGAAHHLADLAHEREDDPAAIAALEKVTEGSQPRASPETAEVLADTRARLADLRSLAGHYDGALSDVDEGLRLATSPTHFRGHLLEVRGLVLERRANALTKAGNSEGAARSKAAAIDAFAEAVRVQEEVIAESLTDAGP
jgi:tetratricopeptide (TPR) repeat protein